MQYPKIAFSLFTLALYLPSSYAETIYMSVSGMSAGSSLIQMDESLNILSRTPLTGTHISSLDTTSHDKKYIYGIDSTGMFAFDTQQQEFIYRFSNIDGIFPTWMSATKPVKETHEEWLHTVNAFYPNVLYARETLIALEKAFFTGDKTAKSEMYDFEDYHWQARVIEDIVVDPKDEHHFFLILSGDDRITDNRERHIIEMRFNVSEKRYEMIKAVPFNYPDHDNRVSKAIIRPQGDWIYLQLNSLTPSIIMVDTTDLSHVEKFLTDDLEDVAVTEDGKTLMATYRSQTTAGLKLFTHIDNPDKFKMQDDSTTPTFTDEGSEYSYRHERILSNKTYHYVPEYFALANPIGNTGSTEHYFNIVGNVSTIHTNDNNIKRGDMAPLLPEDNERIQECVTADYPCLMDSIAHSYSSKNKLYMAKSFFNADNSLSVLISKIDLKKPEKSTFVFIDDGMGRYKHPSSILIIE